ncbi:hypothetical protein GCM10010472_71320 [Pseudonocardia halophobica]|uniref:Uncharacterized protein n=1 Tax=Pseudonocardia halophobica TaxID=29401 RepID=A0A9W6KZT8_9PSEU|nr:hypothetical protein [Pseudonocardia halophobica]GLL10996.1 hypothetical protein GCM10017577_21370 [Pseudonocardia halophobica]
MAHPSESCRPVPSRPRDLRRLEPERRLRFAPGATLARWWRELTLLGGLGVLWSEFGWVAPVTTVGTVALSLLFGPARERVAGEVLALVVLHRVRVGCVWAGLENRSGNLPLLVNARPCGEAVVVTAFCRLGTRREDFAAAAEVIAEACGALRVIVARDSPRRERMLIVVVRPRWGWPGR